MRKNFGAELIFSSKYRHTRNCRKGT